MVRLFNSYYKKVISLILLLSIIPILLLSSYLYAEKFNSETNSIKTKLSSLSETGASNIANLINERKNNILSIAQDNEVIAETKTLSDPEKDTNQVFNARLNLESELDYHLHIRPWIYDAVIYDINTDDILFYTTISPPKTNLKTEKHFQEAVQRKIGMSEVQQSQEIIKNEYGEYEKGVPVLLVSAPIQGEEGIEAILTVHVDIFQIQSTIPSIEEFSTADLYVVNSDGYFISQSAFPDRIQNMIKKRPPLELRLIEPESKEFTKIFQKANSDKTILDIDGYTNYVGNTVIGSITPIKGTDWYFVAEIEKDDAFYSLFRLQIILLFTFAIIALVIIFISLLFAGALTKPITQLKNSMDRISLGYLDTVVPISGDDEISRLTMTFNEMARSLRESVDRVSSAEQRYHSLYDNAPDLLRTITTDGIIIDCNKEYATSLGYSKNEVIGKSIFAHTADQNLAEINDSFETWKRTGHVSSKEIWFKRKNGTTFPGLLSATNLYDKDDNLIGSNTIIKNLEEIFNARKDLGEEKIKRLSEVGQLASRIAHDLKNPLSVIKNTINLMKIRSLNIDEKTKADISRLDRAIMRMSHQVDEVLDYVSPKPLNVQNYSVRDIIINTLDRIAKPPGISIEIPQNDVTIKCDSEKLEIVFANLITNAIQAMNNTGQIYLRIKEEPENVIIEVEDTGPGIPDDALPKIFDPLFTTRQVGTGLGLVSCKTIVEKHGGKIDVHTIFDKGTTFIIRLPKTV